MSLFSHRLGVVLGALAVADETDEITASADTLAMFMLTAAIITGDAMLTQHAIAEGVCPGQV